MPTSIHCIYQGRNISIEEALDIRGTRGSDSSAFQCEECGLPVRAHAAGGNAGAHFEHYSLNQNCSLSGRRRRAVKPEPDYSIDDEEALEGYRQDRTTAFLTRNRSLIKLCKERDDYRCQSCKFKLEAAGKFVIECHHLNPLSSNGARITRLEELVCLCPTCHRIAHTRKIPFTVSEIRRLINAV